MVPLREFLQSRGRLGEAGLILNFELGFQPNQARSQDACRSLLDACSSSASGQEPIWYIESKARLHLAKSLNGQGRHEQAAKEFELAKTLLQQAPVPTALNRAEINVRFVELQSSADIDSYHSLQRWIDCAETLSETEDSSELSSARTSAAAAAHEILKSNASDENWKRFYDFQALEESMLEKLGDVYTIYFHHCTRLYNQHVRYNGPANILKWKHDFDRKYPYFRIWNLEIVQSEMAIPIYQEVNDADKVLEMVKEIQNLNHDRDVFWSSVDERYTSQTEMGQDEVSNSDDEERTNEAFHPTGIRNAWQSEWDKEISINVGQYKHCFVNEGELELKSAVARLRTLLKWLKSSPSRGELSMCELERILFPTRESLSTGSRIQCFEGLFVKRREAINVDEEREVGAFLGKLGATSLGIQLFGTERSPPSPAHWHDTFATLRDWLFQGAKYNEAKRHRLLLDLQIQMLWKVLNTGSLKQQALEAQRVLDLIPTLCTEAREKQSLGVWRNILCVVKQEGLRVEDEINRFEDHPKFREIAHLYESTLNETGTGNEIQMGGHVFMQAVTSASLAAHYSFPAWNLRLGATEPFFRYCELAEQLFERTRESWKLLQGWEKVEKVSKAIDQQYFRHQVAASAVIVLSRFPDSEGVERDQKIWTKIQKEKSWGLGWLMQTNTLQRVEKRPVRMNAISEFNPLPVITLEDLQSIGGETEDGVVYVDWYDGRRNALGLNYSPNVLLLTVSNRESPKSWQLDITWAEVDIIVKKFLEADEREFLNGNARKLLVKLNPLVQPLKQASKPGQVLVFSAIGDLHCVPLHALEIDNEVIIRRNPVVYCSSMTVLKAVFQARKKNDETNHDRRFSICLCLGDVPSADGKASQDGLVQMFAAKGFRRKPLRGSTFNYDQFKHAIQESALDLFHYHGHATFECTDPLEQGLEFNNDRRFNLREVFQLGPLPNSYHATLLGCGSGKSKTTRSHDVLGLVSSFLYSGASSTVSALWTRIDDKDAALYSKHFYNHFEHALEKSDGSKVINLATANQKAVLKIMDERPGLYHWGSFVLNGYWIYRIPQKSNRQKRKDNV